MNPLRLRALWRAAMRGESHVPDDLHHLLAHVPAQARRAIVLWVNEDNEMWSAKWIGVSAEQVASALYQTADAVVDQKIPPPDWRTRIR